MKLQIHECTATNGARFDGTSGTSLYGHQALSVWGFGGLQNWPVQTLVKLYDSKIIATLLHGFVLFLLKESVVHSASFFLSFCPFSFQIVHTEK